MFMPGNVKEISYRVLRIGTVLMVASILVALVAVYILPLDILQIPVAILWSVGLLCVLLAGPVYLHTRNR